MLKNFEKNHGYLPKEKATPLVKNDHPEMDDTKELGPKDLQLYQSMIGKLQWLVTLGRFNIHAAVTTLSCFLSTPRVGHLERAPTHVRLPLEAQGRRNQVLHWSS